MASHVHRASATARAARSEVCASWDAMGDPGHLPLASNQYFPIGWRREFDALPQLRSDAGTASLRDEPSHLPLEPTADH